MSLRSSLSDPRFIVAKAGDLNQAAESNEGNKTPRPRDSHRARPARVVAQRADVRGGRRDDLDVLAEKNETNNVTSRPTTASSSR